MDTEGCGFVSLPKKGRTILDFYRGKGMDVPDHVWDLAFALGSVGATGKVDSGGVLDLRKERAQMRLRLAVRLPT